MAHSDEPIRPDQCRAARGLLDWSQSELAEKAGLSESTVRNFEKGLRRNPSKDAQEAIRKALAAGGIELIAENGGGAGVRLKKRSRQAPRARKI